MSTPVTGSLNFYLILTSQSINQLIMSFLSLFSSRLYKPSLTLLKTPKTTLSGSWSPVMFRYVLFKKKY